ncbi:chemotaxis protein CheA [Labrys monachus]|uniref:histidine kinase n=1 Tax=Labrys monachus TaxID=217067 RepID=A0ABU0FLP8_9HYPH|nr:chemotaxis protein CheA [Labrys monachus]MDQ0395524.1 two-component system chemotaxis sensor kinase CheA [Labrys monachus]
MNEFIEQFLIESRELVEQATNDLLSLEADPQDRASVDRLFRALHTLKGAAGIVDFDAMAALMHATEDALSEARSGRRAISPALVTQGLASLDQVSTWLDTMQATGVVPADAGRAAEAVAASFEPAPASAAEDASEGWASALRRRHGAQAGTARVAIRYRPASDCFFHGEDPLELFSACPGLLAVDLVPLGTVPAADALNPYDCLFGVLALSGAPLAEVEAWLAPLGPRAEAVPLAGEAPDLPAEARDMIEAQIRLLGEAGARPSPGRAASAARSAANILRSLGRAADGEAVDRVLADTGELALPAALAAALRRLLGTDGPGAPAADGPGPDPAAAAPGAVRVEFDRIEALIKLASQLTVVKNALGHSTERAAETTMSDLLPRLKEQHAALDRLVRELQRAVLDIRVFPFRHVFQRFPRLVREMATSVGKSARLVVAGETTEADRAIVEGLFEPLLHVLRNAVDHGVETAVIRAAAGKPPTALIHLRAMRSTDRILVEVEDDGSGIDVERVRRAAVERGIVDGRSAEGMAREALVDLIFAPGFSTAPRATALSGRGVGMDVVRAAVERMNGRVGVESADGKGTLIRFDLPFTVMLMRVITVEAGGQAFGIPVEAVVETVSMPRSRISAIGRARAFVHRDRTIPLVWMSEMLGERAAAREEGEARIVILSAGGESGGLEVDRFGTKMDVMLNPLEGVLAGAPGISGTTLLGDGRVLIVLDPLELIR